MANPRWHAAVAPIARQLIQTAGVPGVVVAVVRGTAPVEYYVDGTDAKLDPLSAESRFPVASITKLATALTVLRLAAVGAVNLDHPLSHYVPEAAACGHGVTLRSLLCHTAGLPGDLAANSAPYQASLDWPQLAQACLATPRAFRPQWEVHYGNVGAGLLAIVVERVTGKQFPAALAELVLQPLQVDGCLGTEPPEAPAHIAGDFGEHAGTRLEPYNSAFWRSLALPWGGLVTTAAGSLALVRAFTAASQAFLPEVLRREAICDQTGGLGGGFFPPLLWRACPWGLGPELRGYKSPHWTPSLASPLSFGHAGASGCLAWCDPMLNTAWVIIGTRRFESWWEHWPAIGAAILESFS